MRMKDAFLALKHQKGKRISLSSSKKNSHLASALSTVWSETKTQEDALTYYPRPQFQRAQWESLNGYWEYAFTRSCGRPEQFEGKILVPFSPESRRSGVHRILQPGEYLWYRRTVSVKIQEGKRLMLQFGAVDQRCAVWWNGKCIGTHENGYLPFSFDVTEFVQEGENSLWVRVQDESDQGEGCRGKQTLHPGGMFYTAQSGIWQTVWMEWVPESRMEELKITPLFDEEKVRLTVRMTQKESIRLAVYEGLESDGRMVIERIVREREILQGEAGLFQVTAELDIPGFREWSPECPFLYRIALSGSEDRVSSYFAMRKFSAGRDENGCPRLMLNNRPYFFNGVLDQGYWPETLMTPPSDDAMIFDIVQMKRLGFNMLRKHVKVEPLRWYYHCDRAGMIVWQDMVNGGGPISLPFVCYLPNVVPAVISRVRDSWYAFFSRADKIARRKWEQDCLKLVNHLYNCPCISMWVPFNEGWGQFDALRIADRIRKEDDTRLIDHASGWFDQGGGDVTSVHNYFRPLNVRPSTRPYVLSEYGGYVCPVEGHLMHERSFGYKAFKSRESFTESFHALQKQIHALEAEGLCGAVYTQVSDIEEEINGLYTYDRKVCKVKE